MEGNPHKHMLNHTTHQTRWCVAFFLCNTHLNTHKKRKVLCSMPKDSAVLLLIRRIPNCMEAVQRKDCFSRVPNATWTEWSKNDSMNMTLKSAFCDRLPSHKITIQLSICWMRLNIWGRDLLPGNLMLLREALTTLAGIPVKPFWQDEVIS